MAGAATPRAACANRSAVACGAGGGAGSGDCCCGDDGLRASTAGAGSGGRRPAAREGCGCCRGRGRNWWAGQGGGVSAGGPPHSHHPAPAPSRPAGPDPGGAPQVGGWRREVRATPCRPWQRLVFCKPSAETPAAAAQLPRTLADTHLASPPLWQLPAHPATACHWTPHPSSWGRMSEGAPQPLPSFHIANTQAHTHTCPPACV